MCSSTYNHEYCDYRNSNSKHCLCRYTILYHINNRTSSYFIRNTSLHRWNLQFNCRINLGCYHRGYYTKHKYTRNIYNNLHNCSCSRMFTSYSQCNGYYKSYTSSHSNSIFNNNLFFGCNQYCIIK